MIQGCSEFLIMSMRLLPFARFELIIDREIINLNCSYVKEYNETEFKKGIRFIISLTKYFSKAETTVGKSCLFTHWRRETALGSVNPSFQAFYAKLLGFLFDWRIRVWFS